MQPTVDRIVRLLDGRSVSYAQYGSQDGFRSSIRTAVWPAASTWLPQIPSRRLPVSG
jgi:hypothetical protein